jgi:UDP-N-acetylglucosamine 2-epimerase (non-hydrolysing)
VDLPERRGDLLTALERLGREIPIVFPVHPRTSRVLEERTVPVACLRLIEPLGYLNFMKLVAHARLVLTDSGGLQEETTALGVPCLTLRNNTERPITLEQGTNTLVGPDPCRIVSAGLQALGTEFSARRPPELWDGRSAERIVNILAD